MLRPRCARLRARSSAVAPPLTRAPVWWRHGSVGGEEAAEGALVEDQRDVGVGVVVEVDDAADDHVVVAELEDVLDRAVDPRADALDDRAAGRRRRST